MRTHLAIFFADCGDVAVLKTCVIKSSNPMGWLHLRLAAINVENRGNEFNRRYLTCQISAILNADRGDRRIKSPSVSLALSPYYGFKTLVDASVIVDRLLPSLQTPEHVMHGPLAIDLIPMEL